MEGVDPYGYMQDVGARLDRTDDPRDLDRMLDSLEYLYEILDPELQDLAEGLMERLRDRLTRLRGG